MNWNCDKCKKDCFKFKLIDLSAQLKSGVITFADLPTVLSKKENESLLCGNCVNSEKDTNTQHPVSEIHKKVEEFQKSVNENVEVVLLNGIFMLVPDSKKDEIAAIKHIKEIIQLPKITINNLNQDSVSELEDLRSSSSSVTGSSVKQETSADYSDFFDEQCTPEVGTGERANSTKLFAATKTGKIPQAKKITTNRCSKLISKEDRDYIQYNINGPHGVAIYETKTCKICGKSSIHYHTLFMHIFEEHLQKTYKDYHPGSLKARLAKKGKTTEGKYECLICKADGSSKLFQKRESIMNHLTSHDIHTIKSFVID